MNINLHFDPKANLWSWTAANLPKYLGVSMRRFATAMEALDDALMQVHSAGGPIAPWKR